MTEHLCRRTVLRGAAVAAGSCLLASCGSDSNEPTAGTANTPDEMTSQAAADVLAALDDIPVGSAVSAKAGDQPILLVRTSETEVTGLSAVCTHQRCTVAPDGEQLSCPCHGSLYDLSGEVKQGPAPRALDPFPVSVVDGSVVAG